MRDAINLIPGARGEPGKVPRAFFQRDPRRCAAELIGCELVWDGCAGTIVETEAYSVVDDEACHTFMRPSARAFVSGHAPGAAYIYMNYGMHLLLNVLVKDGTEDGFVLIRALEPLGGVEKMTKRRGLDEIRALCSGPGKLAQALGVQRSDHGQDLCESPGRYLKLPVAPVPVVADVRIGISKAAHLMWRYLAAGSSFVSVKAGRSSRPCRLSGQKKASPR